MLTAYFGRKYTIQTLRAYCQVTQGGVTFLDLSEASEKLGLHALGVKLDVSQLREAQLPCILHWRRNHFVILHKIKNGRYHIVDPSAGHMILPEREFVANWVSSLEFSDGVALFVTPTPRFFELEEEKTHALSWAFITRYLFLYKQLLVQLLVALGIGALIQLVAPFLTQSIVDVGIRQHNLGFIQLVLVAQVVLFIGSTSVDFIRSWILLHISTRVNISILTDLLTKLMKLPIRFFDTKTPGDLMQRIQDEKRIEAFLTGSTLVILFSIFNFIVFSVVIAVYDLAIFSIFAVCTALYIGWILVFLKRRKELDYKQFSNNSRNQDNIIELVYGMQEIKLNNAELQKRWKWEHIQARLFRFNMKTLALNQYQQAGAVFINQGKNIFITYLSARAVIDGDLTLGAMVAIQYIIGQLNGPVEQFLGFIRGYQDARISVERLNEIHRQEDEEPEGKTYAGEIPRDRSIRLSNVVFRYPGAGNEPVLQQINLVIPEGKTTAIVGMSGSGKTTLLKLLLRFYLPEQGELRVGDTPLDDIRHKVWRDQCSMVMQDGYLFTDTVSGNIAITDEHPDPAKMHAAVHIANIHDVIEALPHGLNAIIGPGGHGISQGQKQRILIARAVYKDPHYIFFDEATNALDANNEKTIIHNLTAFLQGKTVVVVAHRLSTVKNADNIVVLHKGKITEQGTHQELTRRRGEYYNLIKNQLEFGSA